MASVLCACSTVPAGGFKPEDNQERAAMSSVFGHHDKHEGQCACHLYNSEDIEYVRNVWHETLSTITSFDRQSVCHLLICDVKGQLEEGLISPPNIAGTNINCFSPHSSYSGTKTAS